MIRFGVLYILIRDGEDKALKMLILLLQVNGISKDCLMLPLLEQIGKNIQMLRFWNVENWFKCSMLYL